jgi:hypothetical protein
MKEKVRRMRVLGHGQDTAGRLLTLSRSVGFGVGLGGILTSALGQGYFPTVNPFVATPSGTYQTGMGSRQQLLGNRGPGQQEYDIKMGPVLANFTAGVTFSYQSNFNQVSSQSGVAAQSLFTIGPTIGVELQYQVSDSAVLTFGTAVSYQTSIGQLQYDQVSISPNSSLNYRFSIEDVQISVFNTVSTANQATVDPTISGTGLSSLMEFNRLSNSTGLSAVWPFLRDTTLMGGYTYNLNTSLGRDNFQQFDSGTHQFNMAMQQRLGSVVSVGILGTGNIVSYDSTDISTLQGGALVRSSGQIQNGSSGWSIGPTVQWTVTKAITANANLSYSSQRFSGGGLIADSSNFAGLTASVGLNHQLTRTVTQSISGGRSINPGNGSNFTEIYNANYQFLWNFMKRSALNFGFGFNRFAQSGAGFAYVLYDPTSPPPDYLYINENGVAVVPLSSAQVGQQYLTSVGTTYTIAKNLMAGLSYMFTVNDVNQTFSIQSGAGSAAFGGYQAHNVILSLAYQF